MELYHYHAPHGNFGDDLNLWLWDEILPGWREAWPDTTLVGVGTLINHKLPRGVPKLIAGSGMGYGSLPDADLMAECRFACVRGPRSAAALGLPPEKGIIDPAVMVTEMAAFRNIPRGGRPVFVPHADSVSRQDWRSLCDAAGVDYVSPGNDSHELIRRLAAAPLVIAEALHAVILADAFGTPWHAVSISHRFHASKWMDWADSLGVDPRIRPLYPLMERLAALAGGGQGGGADHPPVMAAKRGALSSASPSAAAPRRKPEGYRLRARRRFEAWQTVGRLRRLAAEPGQTSSRATLAAAKARYRAVLDDILREFA